MVSKDGQRCSCEVDGNVRYLMIVYSFFTLTSLSDIIFAAADGEGNFLLVEVGQPVTALHTNKPNPMQAYTHMGSLSCLPLNVYVTLL